MKIFLPLLLIVLAAGCRQNPSGAAQQAASPTSKAEEAPAPAAPIDGEWLVFWNSFQDAVVKRSRALVISMTNTPLPGTSPVSVLGSKDGMSTEELNSYFGRIFYDEVVNGVGAKQASDIVPYIVPVDGYGQSQEKKLGIAPGSKVYVLDVHSSLDATRVVSTLYFAKLGGRYKLAWINLPE